MGTMKKSIFRRSFASATLSNSGKGFCRGLPETVSHLIKHGGD